MEELRQLFKNNSDCYADTWKVTDAGMIEGEPIQAMTEDRFIETLKKLSDGKGLPTWRG